MAVVRGTASVQIFSVPGRIYSAVMEAGVDAAVIGIADKVGSGGDKIIPLRTAAANTIDRAIYPDGMPFLAGAYLTVVSGTTPLFVVDWEPTKG